MAIPKATTKPLEGKKSRARKQSLTNKQARTKQTEETEQTEQSLAASYPFVAIVGQEEMKNALILNVIDPTIGGVMIMGHRGTGKSTAVRALAELLPSILKVKDCLYGCDPADSYQLCSDCCARRQLGRLPTLRGRVPVVDLPLGATEDRVCG